MYNSNSEVICLKKNYNDKIEFIMSSDKLQTGISNEFFTYTWNILSENYNSVYINDIPNVNKNDSFDEAFLKKIDYSEVVIL